MDSGKRAVVWTPSARDSLDEILQYIATDSPAAHAFLIRRLSLVLWRIRST